MSIIKEEPPARTRKGSSKHAEIAEKLRTEPGVWFRVLENVGAATTTQINSGVLLAYRPKGSFEAKSAPTPDGKYTVWARYLGEEIEETNGHDQAPFNPGQPLP